MVDNNELVLRLVREALVPPEFEVHTFADSREALFKLHQIEPDLIVSDLLMPGMDGREFFQLVKRSPDLRDVPFIFLSGVQSNDEIVGWLQRGADDFVNKPITLQRLQAKVRAVLRLADRGVAAEERRHERLSGVVGGGGTLALIRYCEDVRLSGRLTVRTDEAVRWAEFLGGELTIAGGTPEISDCDPIDALLALQKGTYEVVQRRLDPQRLQELQESAQTPAVKPEASEVPNPVHAPAGRLARVKVRGTTLEVQTEAENRPNFTITTIVARGGRVVRKIESSWTHALQRQEDEQAARAQLERQHDRVLASVRTLALDPTPAPEPSVDGALLAWAASFIAEHVRDLLGTVMTATLLRRAHGHVGRERPLLATFGIGGDARVTLVQGGELLSPAAVAAVAAWVAMFLAEAETLSEGAKRIRVRQATHMMELELEQIGFYAALTAAAGRNWD